MFDKASGQLVNFDKCSVVFSKNIREDQTKIVCEVLGNVEELTEGKYLGLPMMISKSKS